MDEYISRQEAKKTLALDYAYAAADLLDTVPTADVAPVRHGLWLPDMELFDDDPISGVKGGYFQTGWKCSVCGRNEPQKEQYCNCGAKMDLEGTHDPD